MTEAIQNIDKAVGRLTEALDRLVVEHGAEAVDISLLAYQLDAARYLGLCAIGLLFAFPAFNLWRLFIREMHNPNGDEDKGCVYFFGSALFSIPAVMGAASSIAPAHWAAAFGYPEVLMATRLLANAGAM